MTGVLLIIKSMKSVQLERNKVQLILVQRFQRIKRLMQDGMTCQRFTLIRSKHLKSLTGTLLLHPGLIQLLIISDQSTINILEVQIHNGRVFNSTGMENLNILLMEKDSHWRCTQFMFHKPTMVITTIFTFMLLWEFYSILQRKSQKNLTRLKLKSSMNSLNHSNGICWIMINQ